MLSAGTPAPAYMPLPSEPTMTSTCSGSRAPRPTLCCASAGAASATAVAVRQKNSRNVCMLPPRNGGLGRPLLTPALLISRVGKGVNAVSLAEHALHEHTDEGGLL